jgi:hypothetical protein
LGAARLLCGPGHHGPDVASAVHVHDNVAHGVGHDHAAGSPAGHDDVTAEAGTRESFNMAGKCRICSECCSSAAVVPSPIRCTVPSDTPLRVSILADAAFPQLAGDALFRPPRTTSRT